jgi:hypothetical protein
MDKLKSLLNKRVGNSFTFCSKSVW